MLPEDEAEGSLFNSRSKLILQITNGLRNFAGPSTKDL